MSYIQVDEHRSSLAGPGCGPGCHCAGCRQHDLLSSSQFGAWPRSLGVHGWIGQVASLLSPAQLHGAVAQNQALASRMGWGPLFGAISSWILNFQNQTPSAENFAQAVAKWQSSKGLRSDGVLGLNTWNAMLKEARAGLPRPYRTPEGVTRPHGLARILATFGDPTAAGWEAHNIIRVVAPPGLQFAPGVTRLPVHRLLAPHFTRLFSAIQRGGLWSGFYPSAGVYVCRTKKLHGKKPCGTPGIRPDVLSNHSWGIAIDFRAADYPFYTSAMQAGGVPLRYPPTTLAREFQVLGFHWGLWFMNGRLDASGRINFADADPMHFQFATGY